jgi:hypothetical protein
MSAASPSTLFTQRDLNCLADPDKNTRKKALEKIHSELTALVGKRGVPAEVAQECQTTLQTLLLKGFKDSAEKCRELSVGIMALFLPILQNPTPFAEPTVRAIKERLTGQPPEESEEVRLAMLQLLHGALVRSPSALWECLNDVSQTVERAALDKFPDAKKVASDIAIFLAEQDTIVSAAPNTSEPPRSSLSPTPLQDHCPPLIRAFTTNLAHQQQKIRLSALQVSYPNSYFLQVSCSIHFLHIGCR